MLVDHHPLTNVTNWINWHTKFHFLIRQNTQSYDARVTSFCDNLDVHPKIFDCIHNTKSAKQDANFATL